MRALFFTSICVVCICLFTSHFNNVIGQHVFGEYTVQNWNSKNGMPTDLIQSIAQTKDGFLWLTSFEGVFRFDGHSFSIFNRLTILN